MKPQPFYATEHGKAYLADALDLMPTMADSSVGLIFTSPPYALHFKKEYGNVNQGDYIAWFLKFARHYTSRGAE
jgi:DNA modification methylase